MSKKLMEYFNKQPRLGCMSTSGKDGKVNVACFGSPHMIDEKTVLMGISKNRTFENLQENPNAVFMTKPSSEAILASIRRLGYSYKNSNLVELTGNPWKC